MTLNEFLRREKENIELTKEEDEEFKDVMRSDGSPVVPISFEQIDEFGDFWRKKHAEKPLLYPMIDDLGDGLWSDYFFNWRHGDLTDEAMELMLQASPEEAHVGCNCPKR